MLLLAVRFALSLDVDRIPTLIYDQDQTQASRDLIRQSRRRGSSRSGGFVDKLRHRPKRTSTAARSDGPW